MLRARTLAISTWVRVGQLSDEATLPALPCHPPHVCNMCVLGALFAYMGPFIASCGDVLVSTGACAYELWYGRQWQRGHEACGAC